MGRRSSGAPVRKGAWHNTGVVAEKRGPGFLQRVWREAFRKKPAPKRAPRWVLRQAMRKEADRVSSERGRGNAKWERARVERERLAAMLPGRATGVMASVMAAVRKTIAGRKRAK